MLWTLIVVTDMHVAKWQEVVSAKKFKKFQKKSD